MMSVAFYCTRCAQPLQSTDESRGSMVQCPKCRTRVKVPEVLPEASVVAPPQPNGPDSPQQITPTSLCLSRRRAVARLRTSSMALGIVAVLSIVITCAFLYMDGEKDSVTAEVTLPDDPNMRALLLALVGMNILLNLGILYGVRCMFWPGGRWWYRFAVLGCVLGLVPCPPTCIMTAAFAIWCLFVLTDRKIINAFPR